MALYSVVVPVYNSEHTLEELYERLCGVFDRRLREDFELLLVDDGSKDRSYEVMKSIRERDRRVKIFQMARNFGQHPAILCGLHYVSGDFVITMDDDLQHPPEEIPKLIGALEGRDDVDVVVARYVGRQHNAVRRLGTRIYAFATALEDPARVIAEPGGYLIAPLGGERVGDVSNVVFTNGAIAAPDGKVYIYYASSDTRLHVATTDIDRLTDYVFHTPPDPLRSADCVRQRTAFIRKNLAFLRNRQEK